MGLNLFNFIPSLGGGLKGARPPYEGTYIYILLFFIGTLVADTLTTHLRGELLPTEGARPMRKFKTFARPSQKLSIWSSLRDQNIFNADHVLAPTMMEKQEGLGTEDDHSLPVLSRLPLKLVGTIIHWDPERSVATTQVRGKDIHAVVKGEKVEQMAEILEIKRYRVVFRNLRNRKLEYIEIKEENKVKMGTQSTKKNLSETGQVEKTNFNFKRSLIDKHLENLPRILQDARAVPYVAPGSGGEVSGFKLVNIKAGSVYETLGLKRGDIIKGVNGEPVDTPQKAMELYQALKNADSIQLELERDGSPVTFNYKVE